jgi:RNA polymerase sigma factor (sigma-70 family)
VRLSPSIAILRTQSDERLVALARGGSENAFQAIAERYRRQLHGACRRVLSESRAEDAVQQAFMAAWVALERGDDVVNLRAWLLMIARNTALNALRAPGYDFGELRESFATGAAPQDELERREVMRQTLAGLAALPERQREALLRSAVEGVAYADIARDLGLSVGATRQLVLRARTTMRAAATAVVPWPLAQWVAVSGRADATLRVAEIATASGGAGTAALLAKAGIVAVVAGGVAAGPVLRYERVAPSRASATHSAVAPAPAPAPGPAPAPAAISAPQPTALTPAAARVRHIAGDGSSRAEDDADRDTFSDRGDDESDDDASESSSGRGGDGEGDDDDRSGSSSGDSGGSDGSESSAGRGPSDHERGGGDGGPRGSQQAATSTAVDPSEPAHPESSDSDSEHSSEERSDASSSGSDSRASGDPGAPQHPVVDE